MTRRTMKKRTRTLLISIAVLAGIAVIGWVTIIESGYLLRSAIEIGSPRNVSAALDYYSSRRVDVSLEMSYSEIAAEEANSTYALVSLLEMDITDAQKEQILSRLKELSKTARVDFVKEVSLRAINEHQE
ncbi:MAG: hypothetical protein ACE37I_18715 [Rubinisphaera brasiliensis]|uniref:hypothetical protein n=1 Tax=Rubinisphaera brasiliensis TaxID=119 RepID=UPI00391B187C